MNSNKFQNAELTKIHSRTLTDAFRHSTNGPEFQLWPALSLSCYLVWPTYLQLLYETIFMIQNLKV